jgi:hypothetical protein
MRVTEKDGKVVDRPIPVIVDMGSESKKAIKKLKRGTGKLMDEVHRTIDQVRESLTEEERNKPILPLLVIYRQKTKSLKPSLPSIPNPFTFFR